MLDIALTLTIHPPNTHVAFITLLIKVNTDEEPMVFKAQLFALTGVQPERQKIMLKGAILGDASWDKVNNLLNIIIT